MKNVYVRPIFFYLCRDLRNALTQAHLCILMMNVMSHTQLVQVQLASCKSSCRQIWNLVISNLVMGQKEDRNVFFFSDKDCEDIYKEHIVKTEIHVLGV